MVLAGGIPGCLQSIMGKTRTASSAEQIGTDRCPKGAGIASQNTQCSSKIWVFGLQLKMLKNWMRWNVASSRIHHLPVEVMNVLGFWMTCLLQLVNDVFLRLRLQLFGQPRGTEVHEMKCFSCFLVTLHAFCSPDSVNYSFLFLFLNEWDSDFQELDSFKCVAATLSRLSSLFGGLLKWVSPQNHGLQY